jgi:hypothetical protein
MDSKPHFRAVAVEQFVALFINALRRSFRLANRLLSLSYIYSRPLKFAVSFDPNVGLSAMTSAAQRVAIKKLIRDYTKEMTASPEKARAALVKEGIYTRSGELSHRYGGPKKKST